MNFIFSFAFMSTPLFLLLLFYCVGRMVSADYDSIYQFGDSLSDTGNYARQNPSVPFTRSPYGVTYFKKPTGRASDGRLMVDFLAQELGLPLLDPYLQKGSSDFRHGVNFATGGATALDTKFLNQYYNITLPFSNNSLHVQLDWFSTHLNSICSSKSECAERIKNSLFVVGEIGLNDYTSGLDMGKSISEIKVLVPHVIKTIRSVIKILIDQGATTLLVPGNFPIGCFPTYLTINKNSDSNYYDRIKCLKYLNRFTQYHNKYLRATLTKLSKENPNVVILYTDYYNAFQWTIHNSRFQDDFVLKACCGTGGDYNFDLAKTCGDGRVSSCLDPSRYISWDGVHFTEKASELMIKWLLNYHLYFLRNNSSY